MEYVSTPGFVRAKRIRLRGRDFTWADTSYSQKIVLVNAAAGGWLYDSFRHNVLFRRLVEKSRQKEIVFPPGERNTPERRYSVVCQLQEGGSWSNQTTSDIGSYSFVEEQAPCPH